MEIHYYKTKNTLLTLLFWLLFGLTSAVAAISIAKLETKYVYAAICGLVFLICVLLINRRKITYEILVCCYGLSIPLNLDVNFFYRDHVGGASGIALSLSMLLGLGLLGMHFSDRIFARSRNSFVLTSKFIWPPVLFAVAGFLSLLNARYSNLVFLELFRQLQFLILMILVMNIRDMRLLRRFLFCLMVGLVVEGGIASIQYVTGKALGLGIFGEEKLVAQNIGVMAERATGTIGHPNILSYFFEILLPVSLAWFLAERSIWMKIFMLVAMATGLAGVVCTLSRGAWVTLPISFSIVLFPFMKRHLFKIRTGLTIILVGVILAVGLYFLYPTIEERFTAYDQQSASSRWPVNVAALSVIRQYPVFGVGLNNFAEVFQHYETTGNSRIMLGVKQVVHNLFLLIWTDVGTIGLFAFLLFYLSPIWIAVHTSLHLSGWNRMILVGIVAGLIAHLIHGLFDPGFVGSIPISVLIYSLMGVIGCIHFHSNQGPSEEVSHTKNLVAIR